MITLHLTPEQARAVSAAINAEIIKGQSTFLSPREVLDLGKALDQIRAQTTANKQSLMDRIETAVEDYCDACDYSNYKQLTAEDVDYLAGELQIGTKELRDLIGV